MKSHLTEHPRHRVVPTTFDGDGNQIDGRYQGAVTTLPPQTSENIDLFVGAVATSRTVGDRTIGATSSKIHRSSVDAAELAARWGTSLGTAEQTLRTTTQRGYRYLHGNQERRFRTRQTQLRRNLLRTAVYSDTLFSDTKSIRGYNCAQLFVTSEGFADGNVMSTKADAYIQLNDSLPRDFSNVAWDGKDWVEFYPDAVKQGEPIPRNAPEPRGLPMQLNMFCDASHATDLVTRRSTTGIIFFLNGAPIKWYSKRQNTIESSTFGSEFVALKIAMEMNDGLRY